MTLASLFFLTAGAVGSALVALIVALPRYRRVLQERTDACIREAYLIARLREVAQALDVPHRADVPERTWIAETIATAAVRQALHRSTERVVAGLREAGLCHDEDSRRDAQWLASSLVGAERNDGGG